MAGARRWMWAAAAAGLLAWLSAPRCGEPTTFATFNIRMFPEATTDRAEVAARIAEVDADVFGVQEIRNGAALDEVLADASRRTGRRYRAVLSSCLVEPEFFSPGVVYDAEHFELVQTRQYPGLRPGGGGTCSRDSLPGVLAVLRDDDDERVAVLSVHYAAFPDNAPRREQQLRATLAIVREVEQELEAHVVVVGDFNTTGFRGQPQTERETVTRIVEEAGLRLTTADLPCTEYWKPGGERTFRPSLLDHVVVRDGDWDPPEVLGMCGPARLDCAPVPAERMAADYAHVSDHCPVRIRGRW